MNHSRSTLIRDLTDHELRGRDALDALRRFAVEFGWRPSDQLAQYPGTEEICNGHLVVEHGLDITAVISFLRTDVPYFDLSLTQRRTLLELSYNNLVDWHLLPERAGMRAVFNRTDPPKDYFFAATAEDDVWRAEAFDRITGKRPAPNIKALDDSLVGTVSFWKRALYSDLGSSVHVKQVSSLINSVIMIRALEDYSYRYELNRSPLMLSMLDDWPEETANARDLMMAAFERLHQDAPPAWIQEMHDDLRPFADWDPESLGHLVRDFYRSRFSPYRYDFHLISKHALSRIYEHYVSLLRDNEADELLLFKDLPDEIRNKQLGSIYTPQYIARFFSRFLKENRTPRSFRGLRVMDPACGSGMFLRTMLEMQCDPTDEAWSPQNVFAAFSGCLGIDVDPNACQATRLSLALLHLVLTGDFPERLNIANAEALGYLKASSEEQFDAIIANPPFVRWDGLSPAIRERVSEFMVEQGFGKKDLYLAFLKAAMDHCADGGAICFVLPHSFLLSRSAAPIRKQLSNEFAIRVLADLSEVRVFDQTGIYVILLIAERSPLRGTPATIVKCSGYVSIALQDGLSGRTTETDEYSVFPASQDSFARPEWILLDPEQNSIRDALEDQAAITDFVDILQGMITGDDKVFIRPSRECPRDEREVWKPLLPDREMLRYGVPSRQTTAVFVPYRKNGDKLSERELRRDFPETWQYLVASKARLKNRSTVKKYGQAWWEPARPRRLDRLFIPKLVSPHLVLVPRFGIDEVGKYAVSHSPYLIPKGESGGIAMLKIVCAFLNSALGHWQLATSSHKYSRGYLMLEVKTLRQVRIPDPASLEAQVTRRIVQLVDTLMEAPDDPVVVRELDLLTADAAGLSERQMRLVGVEV